MDDSISGFFVVIFSFLVFVKETTPSIKNIQHWISFEHLRKFCLQREVCTANQNLALTVRSFSAFRLKVTSG